MASTTSTWFRRLMLVSELEVQSQTRPQLSQISRLWNSETYVAWCFGMEEIRHTNQSGSSAWSCMWSGTLSSLRWQIRRRTVWVLSMTCTVSRWPLPPSSSSSGSSDVTKFLATMWPKTCQKRTYCSVWVTFMHTAGMMSSVSTTSMATQSAARSFQRWSWGYASMMPRSMGLLTRVANNSGS